VKYFPDDDGGVVRLEFDHNHDGWAVGQHFFLCFPALTIWQSHPMTVASIPSVHPSTPHHTYIIRCRKGETGRLKSLALQDTEPSAKKESRENKATTPVILCGPYGTPLLPPFSNNTPDITNILAIAGGTGVSITLPVVLSATSSPAFASAAIDFVWVVRRTSILEWIATEIETLKRRAASSSANLNIRIYITQTTGPDSEPVSPDASQEKIAVADIKPLPATSSSPIERVCERYDAVKTTFLNARHPSLREIVLDFMDARANTDYRTRVIASGPQGIGQDLRSIVAECNDGTRVLKGENRWDVDLHWDDRNG